MNHLNYQLSAIHPMILHRVFQCFPWCQVETQNLLNEIARVTVDSLNTRLGHGKCQLLATPRSGARELRKSWESHRSKWAKYGKIMYKTSLSHHKSYYKWAKSSN